MLKSVIFRELQHVHRLLLVRCALWSMKMPNPELTFYISGVLITKGDAEEMDSLILKTRNWINSLHYVFHLATRKTTWIELELNYLPVFPVLVIDLAFEKTVSVESQSPQQEKATKQNSAIILFLELETFNPFIKVPAILISKSWK